MYQKKMAGFFKAYITLLSDTFVDKIIGSLVGQHFTVSCLHKDGKLCEYGDNCILLALRVDDGKNVLNATDSENATQGYRILKEILTGNQINYFSMTVVYGTNSDWGVGKIIQPSESALNRISASPD